MKRRKGLTWDEHRELGGELQRIDAFLVNLSVRLSNQYGTTHIAAKRASAAEKALGELRSTMDRSDILRTDCPDKTDDELNSVYYGKRVAKPAT